ncbi:hypothetical protein RchiOBHm_Chr7g0213521 [Rosa chinensis]|uniref:Uncharacterized protein n=1 Tax=Rosa chinensis TaxID=74649 RepID=A0A2P6PB09_ROSCH|nr:uncharacterized protein LOC112179189 [Rosa chinensis]PRQ19111.1 hypothetical protein RchiOBHm_Chr7g0213521 [Rosa chinensis]
MKRGSGGGRRSTRRSSAAALLETPPRVASPPSPNQSPPKSTLLNNSNKRAKKMTAVRASSIIGSPSPAAASKPLADVNGLASIPDLKNLASSRLQDLKQHIDRSHTEILKDCDSAHSRLHKRFKIQTQACQQMLDEADKEYKKMTQRTTESREAMMASYAEFMADAQASASRACKTSIAELSQSFEKAIDALNIRYGISSK